MALKIIVTPVGGFVGLDNGDNILTGPLQIITVQDQIGRKSLTLAPVVYAPNGENIKINPNQIIYTVDADDNLENIYKESKTNLSAAKAGIELANRPITKDGVIQFIKH